MDVLAPAERSDGSDVKPSVAVGVRELPSERIRDPVPPGPASTGDEQVGMVDGVAQVGDAKPVPPGALGLRFSDPVGSNHEVDYPVDGGQERDVIG